MSATSPGLPGKEGPSGQPPDIMFDPSSLLDRVAFEQILGIAQDGTLGASVFVPASFIRALNEPDLLPTIRRYFGSARDSLPPGDILRMTRDGGLQPYAGEKASADSTELVAHRLVQRRERIIRDILLEEWMFLTGHSWIAARRKKVFDAFKRSGAVVVDFSGQKFDALVARTLHHDRLPIPIALNHRHRIKAAAKWVAAGGGPVLGLIDPMLGTVAGAGTAVFFLFDP